MAEGWTTVSDGKKSKVLSIVLVVIISTIIIASITLSARWNELAGWFKELDSDEPRELSHTSFFTSVTPHSAQFVIYNSSVNLTIMDVRSCECSYNKGHIPNAIWDIFPEDFFNTSNDLFVYCQNGIDSLTFCQNLVNHTYGAIYHLDGGIEEWENAGYGIVKPREP